jgi:hypothetical protein
LEANSRMIFITILLTGHRCTGTIAPASDTHPTSVNGSNNGKKGRSKLSTVDAPFSRPAHAGGYGPH